ncbi:hypothetical protein KY284_010570 [Solanum tuberosum]|nr:hypothetical protein KY284_010570 [Solanum tuberosum]
MSPSIFSSYERKEWAQHFILFYRSLFTSGLPELLHGGSQILENRTTAGVDQGPDLDVERSSQAEAEKKTYDSVGVKSIGFLAYAVLRRLSLVYAPRKIVGSKALLCTNDGPFSLPFPCPHSFAGLNSISFLLCLRELLIGGPTVNDAAFSVTETACCARVKEIRFAWFYTSLKERGKESPSIKSVEFRPARSDPILFGNFLWYEPRLSHIAAIDGSNHSKKAICLTQAFIFAYSWKSADSIDKSSRREELPKSYWQEKG